MTPAQQTDLWYQFHAFIKRYEGIYVPKFNRALREQINAYVESGTLAAVQSEPIYTVLVELYKDVSYKWAHKTMLHTRRNKARQPMGFSERIIELMKKYYGIDLLNDAEGITETTRDVIRKILVQAEIDGIGFDDIVIRLADTALTKIRARLIARTEIVTASNGAAVIQAQQSGLTLNKIWIAARDNRVRYDHREVNGHIVGMDEDFKVGNTLMSQPGDRRGGASNCCNCRCVVGFEEITV